MSVRVKLTGSEWRGYQGEVVTATVAPENEPWWLWIPELRMHVSIGGDSQDDWGGEIVPTGRFTNPMQEQVREFHAAFGAPIADKPTLIPEDRWKLRVELIAEELKELEDAFEEGDLIAVADALGDLLVVVNGGGVETGIDLAPVVDDIHRSNMSKLGDDGKPIYRADGKILKGSSYSPPDLKPIIEAQRNATQKEN